MSARETILARVKANQPVPGGSPDIQVTPISFSDPVAKFKETLTSIGGASIEVQSEDEIINHLSSILPGRVSASQVGPDGAGSGDPHSYSNTEVAMLRGEFAVAENGAIWVTDKQMIDRALPFICLHLVLIVRRSSIVPTMHDAYGLIGASTHEFGTFIAGPSKTADIEQSLVLGAHGAKTLTCFVVK